MEEILASFDLKTFLIIFLVCGFYFGSLFTIIAFYCCEAFEYFRERNKARKKSKDVKPE